MDVFLSHSAADEKLAERLTTSLEKRGLSVWHNDRAAFPGSNWQRAAEEAIRSAGNLVLLIDGHQVPDPAQQFTWRTALEAVWQEPDKVLIPVLRRGAKVPKFALSGGASRVVRLEDARNLHGVAEAIFDIARSGTVGRGQDGAEDPRRSQEEPEDEEDTGRSSVRNYRDGGATPVSFVLQAEDALSAKADRDERLDYIEESAADF